MIRDKYQITECDNCGGDCVIYDLMADENNAVAPHQYVPVDRGFCLDLSGHYGGFTDDMEGLNSARVILCHDCSLAVARALPGIFTSGTGHHSMFADEEHTSCCEFAWRTERSSSGECLTYVGDGAGGWIQKDLG